MNERLKGPLQENLIAILAHDDVNGKIVNQLIDVELFEGDYKIIAERCQSFWRQNDTAPKVHTADLFDDILGDPKNRRAGVFRSILSSMYELAQDVNTVYVLDQLHKFTRLQNLKSAVHRSAEALQRNEELAIDDVEAIWNDLGRTRQEAFQPGLRLTEYERVLEYLIAREREFDTGIKELDSANVVPMRSALMILLGATGKGKSWFLIHLGKRALQQRKKVLHLTFELGEEQVIQRYYQSIFSIRKRGAESVDVRAFDTDSLGRLSGFDEDRITPDFAMTGTNSVMELGAHVHGIESRLSNVLVRRFPPGTMTTDGLRSFLDSLELTEGFVPDILIVDMVSNMKVDQKNLRISIGGNVLDLRAICIERNIAGVTAMQSNRTGAAGTFIKITDIGEDWSAAGTADAVLTLSVTDEEFRLGLARLYVAKAREEKDRFGVLVTQSYEIGQFALQSMILNSRYWDHLDALKKSRSGYDSDDEADEGDE